MRISSLQQEPGTKQLPLYGKPGRPIEKAALPSNAILFFFLNTGYYKIDPRYSHCSSDLTLSWGVEYM